MFQNKTTRAKSSLSRENLKLSQLSCPGLKIEASLELTSLCYKVRLSAKLFTVPYDTVQSNASKPVNIIIYM